MFITLQKYISNLTITDNCLLTKGPIKIDLDKIIAIETEELKEIQKTFTKIYLPNNFIIYLPETIGKKVSVLTELQPVDFRYIQIKEEVHFIIASTGASLDVYVDDKIYLVRKCDESYFVIYNLKDDFDSIYISKYEFYSLLNNSKALDLFSIEDFPKIKSKLEFITK
jgi:hypothetical protein